MQFSQTIKPKKQSQVQTHLHHNLTKTSKLTISSKLLGNKENINNIQITKTENDDSPILQDFYSSMGKNYDIKNKYKNTAVNQGYQKFLPTTTKEGIKGFQEESKPKQTKRDLLYDYNQATQRPLNQQSLEFKGNMGSNASSTQNLGSQTHRKRNADIEAQTQATLNQQIKFYNTSTTSYQKILSSRSHRQLGIESQSLGSSEMRRIIRSSFQKQQDLNSNSFKYSCQDLKNLNLSTSQINGSSVRHSLNITTELGESTGRTNTLGNFEQEQLSHSAYNSNMTEQQNQEMLNYISTEPSPDKDINSDSLQSQYQMLQDVNNFDRNMVITNLRIQGNTASTNHLVDQSLEMKMKELDHDMNSDDILNVDEQITLEDSSENKNYPASPLLPISASRIYKTCNLDFRKITQTSQDFSMSIQQTQIFYDINTLDFFNDNQFAFKQILSYLDIKSCLNLCSSHNFFRSKRQRRLFNKQLKWLMIKGQLHKSLRPKYWVHISRAYDFKKTFTPENYKALSLCEPRCEREIIQDIDRTFPNIKEFRTKEKTFKLHKVLRALSFCLPDMEYCQGLNYVVGSLLLYADEEDSFYICVSMLKNYGFKDCYFEDLNGLQQAVKILDNLIKLHFPHVADFLTKKNIQTGLFATSWFNTLFSYDFSRSFFIKVIDLFLFSGWKVLFQISLAIVQEAQYHIFSADEDDIVNIIKKGQFMNQEQILLNSQNFKITNRLIVDLSKILTKNPFIRNLNLSYDIKAKKRRWEYEIDNSNTGDEYIVRQATLQRQKQRILKKQEKEKAQNSLLQNIIDALTPSFCCSSETNTQDYEQEISMKKRDFRNFSTFSSTNLNGSRHFLLPLEDKQSVLEQWHGQQQYEPDVNFDNQMIEQQTKMELSFRNSVKSHPKKFIETIKKSFVDL